MKHSKSNIGIQTLASEDEIALEKLPDDLGTRDTQQFWSPTDRRQFEPSGNGFFSDFGGRLSALISVNTRSKSVLSLVKSSKH
jgi:hypothetical protein